MPQDDDEEYLTVREVAEIQRVVPRTIYRRMNDGTLIEGRDYYRPGGKCRWRFKRSAFVQWLEHQPPAPAPVDHDIPAPMRRAKRHSG